MDDIKSISQGYLQQLWINPCRRPVLYQLAIFKRPKSTKKLLCGLERRGCFQRGGVIYKRGNAGCKQNKDSTICNFPVGNLSPDRRTDTDLYKNSGSIEETYSQRLINGERHRGSVTVISRYPTNSAWN